MFLIKRLISVGKQNEFFKTLIMISKNDCLTVKSTQHVLSEAKDMGIIGVIFHLGLVLNDCLIKDMTYKQFCKSIDCKYKVLDNFDKLSRKLDYYLDYFVVFSSVASGLGNTGQTN